MPPSLTRRFTVRYILALTVIALLTLAGNLVSESVLRHHGDDGRLINIAGRQRALSQRLGKAALALQLAEDPRDVQRWRDELRTSVAEFQVAHRDLVARPSNSSDLRARFAAIEFDVQALQSATAELLEQSETQAGARLAGQVQALVRHVGPFYARMDEIVGLLEAEALGQVAALRWLSLGLLAGVLATLVLEGFFVFRPAFARLTQEIVAQSRLQRQLLDAVTAEQQRFGSDLHDGLLQQLTGLSLLIRSQLTRASRGANLEAKDLQQIGGLLDEAISEARRMSRAMMPVVLEQKGLAYALEDLVRQAGASGRARCTAKIALRGRVPEPSQANHLFRIAQEAVQNSLKHSRAANIALELLDDDDAFELRVADDGVGLIAPDGSSRSGMGLRTMEYRARAIGAVLQLEANRPQGTLVCCRLPHAHPWGPSDIHDLSLPAAR